jgi:peptidoglycan/LPS O-acetylase OafA/YrhL
MAHHVSAPHPQMNAVPIWATREGFRTNNLDIMRFVLAALVIVSHAFPITLGGAMHGGKLELDAFEPVFRLTGGQASLGDLAVNGFFILSGVLIAHSFVHSKSLGGYLWKRVLRIYPAFLVATFLTACVAFLAGGVDSFAPIHWVRMLLLDSYQGEGAFADSPVAGAVNGSLWTIRYEFGCYLLVAALGLTGLLHSRFAALMTTVAASVVAAALAATGTRLGWGSVGLPGAEAVIGVPHLWPRLVAFFFAGVAFHRWRAHVPHSNKLAGLATIGMVAAIVVPQGIVLLGPACFGYLLLWVAYHPKIKLGGFAKHGDFSYGMYLYAFPIQQLLMESGWATTPLANMALTLPLAVGAGVLSFHLVEKWYMRIKPPQVSGKQQRRIDVGEVLPGQVMRLPTAAAADASPAAPKATTPAR